MAGKRQDYWWKEGGDGFSRLKTKNGFSFYRYNEGFPCTLTDPYGHESDHMSGHDRFSGAYLLPEEAEFIAVEEYLKDIRPKEELFMKGVSCGVYLPVFDQRRGACDVEVRETLESYRDRCEYFAISDKHMVPMELFDRCYNAQPVSCYDKSQDPRMYDTLKALQNGYREAAVSKSDTCRAVCGSRYVRFDIGDVEKLPPDLSREMSGTRQAEKSAAVQAALASAGNIKSKDAQFDAQYD